MLPEHTLESSSGILVLVQEFALRCPGAPEEIEEILSAFPPLVELWMALVGLPLELENLLTGINVSAGSIHPVTATESVHVPSLFPCTRQALEPR